MEKPPIETVEKACETASNQVMPNILYKIVQANVMVRYTNHSALAVSVIRGVNLESFRGPGVSALYNCIPPTPSRGKTATAKTMIPIPPSHCKDCL